jgi:hypothetical protein
MDLLNAIQWPAMLVTVIAAWMIASQKKLKRNWGFWLFLLSNLLWIVWGLRDHAYALIFLQLSGFPEYPGSCESPRRAEAPPPWDAMKNSDRPAAESRRDSKLD